MYQTFYIDIDEEITSIVERLRNAKSSEVVIVVPKRALLIQSIVNLRLLKKESDGIGIALSIVTQDPLGKILIEKAGISYQEKLDEIRDDNVGEKTSRVGENIFGLDQLEQSVSFPVQGGARLDKIGTDNYFNQVPQGTIRDIKNDAKDSYREPEKQKEVAYENNEKIVNKELVTGIGDDIKKKRGFGNMDVALPVVDNANLAKSVSSPRESYFQEASRNDYPKKSYAEAGQKTYQAPYGGSSGDKKIDSFFQHEDRQPEAGARKEEFKNSNLSKHIRKAFFAFGIILVTVFLLAGIYLFLPKATVLIATKASQKSQDVEVRGGVDVSAVDLENESIPAKLISETVEVTKDVSSSGNKSSSGKKARGTITIYNEFSSSAQALVATTRFESEDGKIFRIIKGISVPGTSIVSGETKPGVIEAEVEADAVGDSYNVGPGKFTIPGFKDSGNDKYAKIYGKSTSAMAGGGSGDSQIGNKSISETDIANVKNQLQSELKLALKDKIKISAGAGMVVLDDAINAEEATYSLSNSAGEVVDKFQAKGQIKGSALVFSENDLKSVVAKIIAKSGNGKTSIESGSIALDYGKADVDIKAGTIIIKANGTSSVNSDLDIENLKKGILGKTNAELEAYLGTYSSIEKADVTYWPPFMNSKIPIYENRVEVVVNTDSANK